jgi:hypothetical protein
MSDWQTESPEDFEECVQFLAKQRRAEILADKSLMEGVLLNALTCTKETEDEIDALHGNLACKSEYGTGFLVCTLFHSSLTESCRSHAEDQAHKPGTAQWWSDRNNYR